jgi:hypothetical protein
MRKNVRKVVVRELTTKPSPVRTFFSFLMTNPHKKGVGWKLIPQREKVISPNWHIFKGSQANHRTPNLQRKPFHFLERKRDLDFNRMNFALLSRLLYNTSSLICKNLGHNRHLCPITGRYKSSKQTFLITISFKTFTKIGLHSLQREAGTRFSTCVFFYRLKPFRKFALKRHSHEQFCGSGS